LYHSVIRLRRFNFEDGNNVM